MHKQIKLRIILLALLLVPVLGQAEIYKWTDKNGVVRYSDTPPYTTQKVDTIGRTKAPKPAPAAQANTSQPKASPTEAGAKSSKKTLNQLQDIEAAEEAEQQAARAKAKRAEVEKKNKEEKERQAKIERENCLAARANYQNYAQGGRIYETDANGERKYLGDADLSAGKARAQAEINKYCR